MTEQIRITIEALKKNNMDAYYAEKKEEILPIIKKLINKGDSVGLGGSVTLSEIGVIDEMRNGEYNLIDRYKKGLSREETVKCFKEALTADVFLTSSNAVTEKGELINVDGNGNRVAAMIYGPDSVIVVVGVNKIVADAEQGFRRIKEIAAPKNCSRLNCQTYCLNKGECMAIAENMDSLSDGCTTKDRICCSYTVQSYQRIKDRIKVIICGEPLGY